MVEAWCLYEPPQHGCTNRALMSGWTENPEKQLDVKEGFYAPVQNVRSLPLLAKSICWTPTTSTPYT
jgi:hypothetical protein